MITAIYVSRRLGIAPPIVCSLGGIQRSTGDMLVYRSSVLVPIAHRRTLISLGLFCFHLQESAKLCVPFRIVVPSQLSKVWGHALGAPFLQMQSEWSPSWPHFTIISCRQTHTSTPIGAR